MYWKQNIPYFLLFFFILKFHPIAGAQIVFRDLAPYSDSIEVAMMVDGTGKLNASFKDSGFGTRRMDILEIENRKYLLIDGHFNVYEWKDSIWNNLYKGIFYGYNYESRKFIHKNEIYSFGGYGYWRQHGDLIRFLEEKGEWEIVDFPGNQLMGNGASFVSDSIFYVINPIRYSDGDFQARVVDKPSKINLNTLTISNFEIPNSFPKEMEHANQNIFETENFVYINSKPIFIFNRQDGLFYKSIETRRAELAFLPGNMEYYVHSFGDSIVVRQLDHSVNSKHDISQFFKYVKPENETGENSSTGFYVIGGLSLLSIIFFILFQWKQKPKQNDAVYSHPMIAKIMNFSGKTLEVEQIDEILEIEDILQIETKRYRRSIQINEINLEVKSRTGKELIKRIKDVKDKRRFLYKIEKIQ